MRGRKTSPERQKALKPVGTKFMSTLRVVLAFVVFAASLLSAVPRSAAQVSSVLSPKLAAAPAQAPAPIDPLGLGRETPRGTVIGFVRAAQDGNTDQAWEFLQSSGRGHPDVDEKQELVDHLLAVINATFSLSSLDSISRDAEVRGDDGRPVNETPVAAARTHDVPFLLTLVRVDDHGTKVWLISQSTLRQVAEAYDSLHVPRLASKLPAPFVKTRALGMPLWQWLAILLLVPLAMALGWFVALVARTGWRRGLRWRRLPVPPAPSWRRFGPGALLVAVFLHYRLVALIGTSLLYRQYYRGLIFFLVSFGAYWGLTHITAWIFRNVSQRLTNHGRLAERSLVSLGQRVLNVLIFVVIALIYLNWLNVNVTAALAGLGIGGLAIGLGAQKTFENLLGGISILTDKAIVVGDACKIGDQSGVVEDIGLRSTRIRTDFRTVVSIPNGTVATATLENFRFRDKILCKQLVRLRYDLSADHVRYALEQIREALALHPKVEDATSRVRLLKAGDYGLEVEIYAYILERDFNVFLATQEDLILQVMDSLEKIGAAIALPSQTTVVAKDSWIDPDKEAAAQRALDRMRDPGVPGPQRPQLSTEASKPRSPAPPSSMPST
jgi:MscS family membrane protein